MTNRTPNGFLQSLTHGDFELFRPHLRGVTLEHSKVLFDVGGTIPQVYFPHTAVISLVVVLFDGDLIEAGMIGRDGVVGRPHGPDLTGPTGVSWAPPGRTR